MKKIKLFFSIASFCFSLAVLCFGVFAATKVGFSISGKMTYEVVDAYIEIDTDIYGSLSSVDFNEAYETAVALNGNSPNLNKLDVEKLNLSAKNFKYNSLEENTGNCEIDGVDLIGYYGYYFVITVKNLSKDVQVYMTADAVIDSDNVLIINSGIVPSVDISGSKIVVAMIIENSTQPIDTESFTVTMQAGAVDESNFILYDDDEFGMYGIAKKDGVTYTGPLVIPEQIDGTPVECIGDFSNLTSVTEIYVPQSILAIKEHCFEGCSSITRLTVPFIGSDNTVAGAEVLGYFFTTEDPDNNDDFYMAQQIYSTNEVGEVERLFEYYIPYSLNTVTITNCYKLIGSIPNYEDLPAAMMGYYEESVFMNTKIKEILITSKNITSLDKILFYKSEVEHVYLSNSITDISGGLFAYCSNIKNVKFPNTIASISNGCFDHCTSLTSVVIPNHITKICSNAFNGCTSLTSVLIPSSVRSIGTDAFYNTPFLQNLYSNNLAITSACDNNSIKYLLGANKNSITTITPQQLEGVVTIPRGLFYSSTSLVSVKLPTSVKYVEDMAFYDCQNLESIELPSSLVEFSSTSFSETPYWYNYDSDNIVKVQSWDDPDINILLRIKYNVTKVYSSDLQGVKYISRGAMEDAYRLSAIVLPTSVKYLGGLQYNIKVIKLLGNLDEVYEFSYIGAIPAGPAMPAPAPGDEPVEPDSGWRIVKNNVEIKANSIQYKGTYYRVNETVPSDIVNDNG